MIRRPALALLFTAALAAWAGCARVTPAERFQRANDAIVAQKYGDAKREYQTLLKEPEQALGQFKQVVAIDPRAPLSFNALASMGRIYQDTMRDLPQAILAYQTLIAYFPKHRRVDRYHHRLIEAYFKMGNLAQVKAEGMSAVVALPDSSWADDILYLVAEACALEGDKRGSEKSLETIVARYPSSEWVGQAHYELAELLEERGDLAGALAHYEQAAPALGESAVLTRKIADLRKKTAKKD